MPDKLSEQLGDAVWDKVMSDTEQIRYEAGRCTPRDKSVFRREVGAVIEGVLADLPELVLPESVIDFEGGFQHGAIIRLLKEGEEAGDGN